MPSTKDEKVAEWEVADGIESENGVSQAESWVEVLKAAYGERDGGKGDGEDSHATYQMGPARVEAEALTNMAKDLSESTKYLLYSTADLLGKGKEMSSKAEEIREGMDRLFEEKPEGLNSVCVIPAELEEIREGVCSLVEELEGEGGVLEEKEYDVKTRVEHMRGVAEEMEKRIQKLLSLLGGGENEESMDSKAESEAIEVNEIAQVLPLQPTHRERRGAKRKLEDQQTMADLPARAVTHAELKSPSLRFTLEQRKPGLHNVTKGYYRKKWEAERQRLDLANNANAFLRLDVSNDGLKNVAEEHLNKQGVSISENDIPENTDVHLTGGSLEQYVFDTKNVRVKVEREVAIEPAETTVGHDARVAEAIALIDPSDSEFQRLILEYIKKKNILRPSEFKVEIKVLYEIPNKKRAHRS